MGPMIEDAPQQQKPESPPPSVNGLTVTPTPTYKVKDQLLKRLGLPLPLQDEKLNHDDNDKNDLLSIIGRS